MLFGAPRTARDIYKFGSFVRSKAPEIMQNMHDFLNDATGAGSRYRPLSHSIEDGLNNTMELPQSTETNTYLRENPVEHQTHFFSARRTRNTLDYVRWGKRGVTVTGWGIDSFDYIYQPTEK